MSHQADGTFWKQVHKMKLWGLCFSVTKRMSWVILKALEQCRSVGVASWGRCLSLGSRRPSGLPMVSRDYSFKGLKAVQLPKMSFAIYVQLFLTFYLFFLCSILNSLEVLLNPFSEWKKKTQRKGLDVPQEPEVQLQSSGTMDASLGSPALVQGVEVYSRWLQRDRLSPGQFSVAETVCWGRRVTG